MKHFKYDHLWWKLNEMQKNHNESPKHPLIPGLAINIHGQTYHWTRLGPNWAKVQDRKTNYNKDR